MGPVLCLNYEKGRDVQVCFYGCGEAADSCLWFAVSAHENRRDPPDGWTSRGMGISGNSAPAFWRGFGPSRLDNLFTFWAAFQNICLRKILYGRRKAL